MSRSRNTAVARSAFGCALVTACVAAVVVFVGGCGEKPGAERASPHAGSGTGRPDGDGISLGSGGETAETAGTRAPGGDDPASDATEVLAKADAKLTRGDGREAVNGELNGALKSFRETEAARRALRLRDETEKRPIELRVDGPEPGASAGDTGEAERAGTSAAERYARVKREFDDAMARKEWSKAKGKIREAERHAGPGRPSLAGKLDKLESREATERAKALTRSTTRATLERSRRLLEDAIRKDPTNEEAKRLLADQGRKLSQTVVRPSRKPVGGKPASGGAGGDIRLRAGPTIRAPEPHDAGGMVRRDRRGDWRSDLAVDEVWVIERSDPRFAPARRKAGDPSQGELRAVLDGKEIPLPLKHTSVEGDVSAFVATVKVTQEYHNPYAEKIEAVYVFPLPQDAAVTDFVMTIGGRKIRGIIREREEARRIYNAAKAQGYKAALLTQERPNIFTQRVANIEPRKQVGITITYFNTLKYSRGEYEFVFPMVVGPRFNPAGWKDGVGGIPRGARATSRQPVNVQHLKPGERSGHDISVTLDIDAGVEIEKVRSPSHAVEVRKLGPSRSRVTLSRLDTIPNRDLVVRYKVAGKTMKTAFMMHRDEKATPRPGGGHFALVLQPPEDLADLPRMPREMVFVLDCSGSMRGRPLEKAKEAMRRCLKKLGPDDAFQIIRFSNNASALGEKPVAATAQNVRRGLAYLMGLRGTGGTRMIEGIKAALDFPQDARRLRVVSFMTDGFIGNEPQTLAAVHEKLGQSRIFSFGVGNSVNRHLLESMAKMGRGAVAFVGLDESAGGKVDLFYERCARPALTDIEIDWGGMQVDSTYPRRVPDLFVGRPVLITGRFEGSGRTKIRVAGRMGMLDSEFTIDVDLDDPAAAHAGITKMWARKKLAELGAIMTHSPSGELRSEMTDLSLGYSVQCRYTAFVAVDSSARTAGGHGISVKVPVPIPDGVRYETTVGE